MITHTNLLRFYSLLLFAITLFSEGIFAQQMDTDALEKAQRGEVQLAEGAFIAYLSDTVTPTEARAGFEKAGLEVIQLDITPVTIRIVNSPADSLMQQFLQHPSVRTILTSRQGAMMQAVQEELKRLGHSNEQVSESLSRIFMSGNSGRVAEYIIRFQYDLSRDDVKKLMTGFRAIAYDLLNETPRTANIRVQAGKEDEGMKSADELPFVESTAMIARINE